MDSPVLDETMLKKKARTPKKETKGVKTKKETPETKEAPETNRKPMVVQMRGTTEWKRWVEELADKEGDTVSKFIERLIRRYAQSIEFREMPKR